ncbi:MAG: hypothetical protein LBB83_11525, partial [Treponema sp.]|nr:hypothetical protein [Treponema sp.]
MKKTINFVLFSLLIILLSYSQQQIGDSGGPIDLVVLVDTSPDMIDHYREFISYASGPFLREFLRIGDTFHILSFSGTPKTELARRIEGAGDVETIIGRLYLLYPLGNRRNLSGALDYAESYIAALPSRPGKLVLFTAGTEVVQLTRTDTDFYRVQFPLTGPLPSSGRPPRPAPAPAPPVQVQPRQPAAQTPPVVPAQPQPRQPPAQTPPVVPVQPSPTQTAPVVTAPAPAQAPSVVPAPPVQVQPRQPAAQTPPVVTAPAQAPSVVPVQPPPTQT